MAHSSLILGLLHRIEGNIGRLPTAATTDPITVIRNMPFIESIQRKETVISGRLCRACLTPVLILKRMGGVLGARHIMVEELGRICILLERASFKLRIR